MFETMLENIFWYLADKFFGVAAAVFMQLYVVYCRVSEFVGSSLCKHEEVDAEKACVKCGHVFY